MDAFIARGNPRNGSTQKNTAPRRYFVVLLMLVWAGANGYALPRAGGQNGKLSTSERRRGDSIPDLSDLFPAGIERRFGDSQAIDKPVGFCISTAVEIQELSLTIVLIYRVEQVSCIL